MSSKLVADDMYFVGIHVIGDKVVEINAESPAGCKASKGPYEIDVCPTVIEAPERAPARNSELLGHWFHQQGNLLCIPWKS